MRSRIAAAWRKSPARSAAPIARSTALSRASCAGAAGGCAAMAASATAAIRATRVMSGGAIFGLDLDADALEERIRENSAGADDDRIVRDRQRRLAFLRDLDIVRTDALDLGLQHDLEAPGLLGCVDLLPVLHLGARETLAAVRQGDGRSWLVRDGVGRLERAVAAADHEHMLPAVLLGIDQAVDDLVEVLARNVELARRSPPTDREQHRTGGIDGLAGFDFEVVADPRDGADVLAIVDLQWRLLQDPVPEFEQLLLADFAEIDLADQRQRPWRGHHHLAAREVGDGAAKAVLLDGDVAQLVLHCGEARRKAGRTGADDHDVVAVGLAEVVQLAHRLHRLASLLDRVADQPHSAELARNEDARHVGLEVAADMRDVDAALCGSEDQGDGVGRARRPAGAVTDAFRRLDELRLAVDQPEDVAFRTGVHTCAATEAEPRIDLGMQ